LQIYCNRKNLVKKNGQEKEKGKEKEEEKEEKVM
jgi:hypothetical protein